MKRRLQNLAGAAGDPGPATERPALTREQVVRAALALLDELGLDGLSMRALADRLGVRAASLYWHLRDKEQLLDLLAESILAEVPEPDVAGGPGGWRASLEAFAWAYRRALLAHRDAARVVAGFQAGPAALRLYDGVLAALVRAGLPAGDAADAAVLLLGHYVPAFVADEAGTTLPAGTGGAFGAPLGAGESARLQVVGGATQLTIRADPDLPDLFAARFDGRAPRIDVRDGVVRITGHGHGRRHFGEVVLNAAPSWDVEVEGGASRLTAALGELRVRSFTMGGGGSEITISLGQPAGTVPVLVNGGVSRMAVHRPAGTAVRVVASGASRLALDELRLGSVGGETRWQSPGYATAEDRYDVEIRGGASRLTVDTETGAAGPPERPAGDGADGGVGSEEGASLGDHPALAAVADRLLSPDMDARFRFGLGVVLDGLERRLA